MQRIASLVLAVFAMGGVCALGIALMWRGSSPRDYDAAVAPLEPVARDPALRELEHRWGFSQIENRFVVQVTPVGDPLDGDECMWSAYEVDRREGDPALAHDARGIVIAWSEDDTLTVDELNRWVAPERLARSPSEIVWVAFVHRSSVVNRYAYVLTGGARRGAGVVGPPLDRADIRVARRDGQGLIGRMTTEAIPPRRGSESTIQREQLTRPWTIAAGLMELLDDTRVAAPDPAPELPTACFVESLPALGPSDEFDVDCTDGATPGCIAACRAGSAGSCLRIAWTLEQGWWHRPEELFRRACVGGIASGCASFATLWVARAPDDPVAASCSLALLERACDAHDADACAMLASGHVSLPAPAAPAPGAVP
jgi:hypothetical protein